MTPTTPTFKAPETRAPSKQAAAAIKDVAAATSVLVQDEEHRQVTGGFKSENEAHYRKFGWLPLPELEIDERVQRPEIPSLVNKIARDFNVDALGTATVSARVDDQGRTRYFVLDGQQRRAGALKYGYDGNIRVDVHYNLTLADEARLFRLLNDRKAVQPIQLFKTALIEGNEHAVTVKGILDSLEIPFGTPRGYSGAKSALRLVARRNGATSLYWALSQIKKIYDTEGDGGCYDAGVVEAFYWLYDHFGIKIDEDNLYNKLSRLGGGVPDLIGHAKTIKSMRSGRLGVNLIRAIIARYNHDKRSARTKLPDWTVDTTDSE
jgi:hypothetical protein